MRLDFGLAWNMSALVLEWLEIISGSFVECGWIRFTDVVFALLQRQCGVSGGFRQQHGNCAGSKRRADESVMAVLDSCNYVIMYDLDRSFSVG